MSASLKFQGLDELRAALKRLPDELKEDALALVIHSGDEAAATIRSAYEASRVIGNLARGVKTQIIPAGRFGAAVAVRSTAKHAFIFENGTQTRKTQLGANRGAMPPGRVFVPIMIRQRRVLHELLVDLVERAGFQVVGTDG